MAGDKAAMFELADYSLKQAETPEQRAAALVLVREAAEAGSAEAKVSLAAELLLSEAGNKDNLQKAVLLLEEAETLKPGSGALPLARLYLDGSAGEKNEQKAEKWLQTAAATDSPIAIYLLGDLKGGGIDTIWSFVDRVFGGKSVSKNKKEAMELYERAARLGYAPAQRSMAWLLYSRGDQSEAEKQRAFQMASDAAAQGDAIAMTYLAAFYEIGYGVRQNPSEAYRWYKSAADKGDISGRYNLAEILIEGRLHPRDINQAVSLLDGLTRETARSEWWAARSKTRLGEVLARIPGDHADPQRAVGLWQEVALIDARAARNLAFAYSDGSVALPLDINQALAHHEMAATKSKFGGDDAIMSMNTLGRLYEYGLNGVPMDKSLAKQWYERAMLRGSVFGQGRLGQLLAEGSSSEQQREGLELIHQAAESGDEESRLLLAGAYASGKVVKKDSAKSNEYLRLAVENGSSVAAQHLAERLLKGSEGLARDDAKALKLLLRFAETGNIRTQIRVADLYEEGRGAPRSFLEAYKWWLIASANGQTSLSEWAKTRASQLESKMTSDQIAEAQKQAANFRPVALIDPLAPKQPPPEPTSSGSGFFITEAGHIVTNAHVVGNARSIRVSHAGQKLDAKLVALDEANDLAIVKVDYAGKPLPVASSGTVRLGATVGTIGYPNTRMQGLNPKLSKGEIASLSGAQDDPRFFQISVPIQPGNSGGALFDTAGNVVGIVSNKLDAQSAFVSTGYLPENVNYAVKSSLLLSLIESVPEIKAKLLPVSGSSEDFENIVENAKHATVFILVTR